ncbi:FAD dependent oxidoreductase [Halenospora varia]|nr:FAD dependent oxidoreductase [Halenospora varia]
MTKITIVGAGITGMAIASLLPKSYEVTIIARNLPGDPDSLEWSSPWAGAVWMGTYNSTPAEQQMQLQAFSYFWKLARSHPESSVKRIDMVDIIDYAPLEKMWYRDLMPEFRLMSKEEMPPDAVLGIQSIVLTPAVFLPWMRGQLESSGVAFKRCNFKSLSELSGLGHDILINATGTGSGFLTDVKDPNVQQVRGQTILVRSNFDKIWIRRGVKDYTYALPRGDGTCILGGIKEFDNLNLSPEDDRRQDIFRRISHNLPEGFPANEFRVVRDIVGIRPQRSCGVRVEKEILNGQKVIHAYGMEGGYLFSLGVARLVVNMAFDFEMPVLAFAKL